MPSTREVAAMSDFSQSHLRHHEYSYRLPTPPRIHVPPPALSAAMPELHMADGPNEDIDTSFLNETNLEGIVRKDTLLEWSYTKRRQAQMIVPWVYLGPLNAAKDKAFLVREGITMMLAVRARDTSMNGALQVGRETCQEVATIEAPTSDSLTGHFSRATRMINQHIARVRQHTEATNEPRIGKVLVFCESGNERSAAVVAAYLMDMLEDFDHVKAMQVCQAQRFCINFDDKIKNVLRSHWDILQAKRAVAKSGTEMLHSTLAASAYQRGFEHSRAQSVPTTRRKRTIDNIVDDEDMMMSEGLDPSDVLRFDGRANTPFHDS